MPDYIAVVQSEGFEIIKDNEHGGHTDYWRYRSRFFTDATDTELFDTPEEAAKTCAERYGLLA